MLDALAASIGRTGRPTSSPKAASAALPPASAAAATAPSEPRSIIARRTSATGTDAARATASVITPSSAPCRSSPDSSPIRNRCSSAVARPNSSPTSALRAAAEPFPATAPIAENAASTSASPSVGDHSRPGTRPAAPPSRPRSAAAAAPRTGTRPRSAPPAARPRAARRQQLDLGQPGAGRGHGLRHLGDLERAAPAHCARPLPPPAPRQTRGAEPEPPRPREPGSHSQYPTGNSRTCRCSSTRPHSPRRAKIATPIATRPKMIRYQAL